MKSCITILLCGTVLSSSLQAQLGRRGGGQQVNLQNRSTTVNRGAAVNRSVTNNANVNRNVNVNVNRNVNVNTNYHGGGCYNCGYYHDNDWNWGSFAAGAAVGVATTAVVAAATKPSTQTVVVTAPAVGSMVTALPGSCASVSTVGGVIYNCNSVYYRPYYQGTSLVYQVVTYP